MNVKIYRRKKNMNEYQEPYEKEISLTELLFFCLKKWRWIAAAMLLAAVLAGIYKYQSTVQENRTKQETQVLEESEEEEEAGVISNPNIEYYNLAIKNLKQEMEGMKEYIDGSVIMQLDPYHLDTGNLSFYLDAGSSAESVRNSLVSAYESKKSEIQTYENNLAGRGRSGHGVGAAVSDFL